MPEKIDDAFLAGHIERTDFERILKTLWNMIQWTCQTWLARVTIIHDDFALLLRLPAIGRAISIRGNMFNIEFVEEEEVMGRLCKWQKCTKPNCGNQVFTANVNVLCDEHKPPRKRTEKEESNKKEKIPDSIKWAVWERDNFTCQHCGSRKNLSVDHIIPESKGGQLTMENTQTLCCKCNSRKGARWAKQFSHR